MFIALVFSGGRAKLARRIIQMVAPDKIGALFLQVRKIWRKSLQNQKKMELKDWFRVNISSID